LIIFINKRFSFELSALLLPFESLFFAVLKLGISTVKVPRLRPVCVVGILTKTQANL
jgi:hypothetical protein